MDETTSLSRHIMPGELVYQDKYQRLCRVVAELDGFSQEYYVSDWGQRAAMLVVRNDELLLVRQYQLIIGRLSSEVPEGKVDEGESPEAAAIRECLEEAGVQCFDATPLLSYHPSVDIWRNHTHIFSTGFTESAWANPGRRA